MKHLCEDCWRTHDAYERKAWLRLRDQLGVSELHRISPCRWPRTAAGERQLYRDLRSVRGPTLKTPIGAEFILAELTRGRSIISLARQHHADSHRLGDIAHAAGFRYVGGRRNRWYPPAATRAA